MIIANPIYHIVFLRLMEHERAAKFFLSTIINQEIESLERRPYDPLPTFKEISFRAACIDYIVSIKTDGGQIKKILAKIWMVKEQFDSVCFRSYLTERKEQEAPNHEKVILPTTWIYVLGFTLPEVETACAHIAEQYRDMINQSIVEENNFIKRLPYDTYLIQAPRITDRYTTRLDKLLSIFEQNNFLADTEIIKEYEHEIDDEEIKIIADMLYYTGVASKVRKEIENEHEAHRTINEMMKNKLGPLWKKIEEQQKMIDEKQKMIDEKQKMIDEKQKMIDEKEKVLAERYKEAT